MLQTRIRGVQAGSHFFDNFYMRTKPAFKETDFFGWEAEPTRERSSSFFYPHEVMTAVSARAMKRHEVRQRGRISLLIGCLGVLGIGMCRLIELAPLLQRYLGR